MSFSARRRARTLAELQSQLDTFVAYYNNERPHSGIDRRIPAHVWAAQAPAGPAERPIAAHTRITTVTVGKDGCAVARPYKIHLGVEWSGHHVQVIFQDQDVAVFAGDTLVRQLQLDPSRAYQPSGLPRHRRPTT